MSYEFEYNEYGQLLDVYVAGVPIVWYNYATAIDSNAYINGNLEYQGFEMDTGDGHRGRYSVLTKLNNLRPP